MWVLFLIPFAVVSGSGIDNENCKKPTRYVCRLQNPPQGYPSSVQELDDQCDLYSEFFRCFIRVEEKCQFEPDSLPRVRGYLEIVNEVCDKDGLLYEAIINNMECGHEFIETRGDRECFELPKNEELVKHIESLMDQNAEHSDVEDDVIVQSHCPDILHYLACSAVKMEEKCGESAMKALVKIYGKLFNVECKTEVGDHLPTIVSMYKAGQDQENEID